MRIFCSTIMICVFSLTNLNAQLEQNTNYGFNVGFVGSLGTHVTRFGIVLQGYYYYKFAQINAGIRVYDNFKDLGPKGEHAEVNGSIGICVGYGKSSNEINRFINSTSNQTGLKNSIGYSYNFYYNKIKTKQVTGTVAFQFNHFSIISENDIFAHPLLDRFRTGTMLLQYQYKDFQYAINATMWTGELGHIIKNDSLFPYNGYINAEDAIYPFLSHGLLSAQVKWANEYGQYLQGNVGVDADQVRNVMQNKTLHTFLPDNYHMPMIDSEGKQYLYRKGQKVRKPLLLFNLHTNANTFY